MAALYAVNTAPQGGAFRTCRAELTALGYSVIPLWPNKKSPAWKPKEVEDVLPWSHYCEHEPSASQLDEWDDKRPNAGIGVCLGTIVEVLVDGVLRRLQLIAIDIDVDGLDCEKLVAATPYSPMEKKGQKGLTRLFLADADIKSCKYQRDRLDAAGNVVRDPDNGNVLKDGLIDLLATGRQTAVPGTIHPVTRLPYTWTGMLTEIHRLPIFAEDDLDRLEDTLGAIRWDGAITVDKETAVAVHGLARPANDNDDVPPIGRETNDAALADIGAWVHDIGLYSVKKVGARYECVNMLRSSSQGVATENRKRNLKIHPLGIRDMGSDDRYTPLDLVMQMRDCDFSEACAFLRPLLGLKGIGDEFANATSPGDRRLIEAEDGTFSVESTGEIVVIEHEVAVASDAMEFPDALTRPPGLLGDIVQHIVDTAASPSRVLALGAALVVLGTIIGRRDATPTMSGTHLYVIGLGRTGCGKQHPQSVGAHLLKIATSDYSDVALVNAPDFMSQTSLIEQIEDKPQSASFIDELGAYLKRVNAPKAAPHDLGIKKVLLSVWGFSFMDYQTPAWAGRGSRTIESPAYSVFGASTPGTFYAALQNDDKDNGMLNRCLLLSTMQLPELVDPQYDFRTVPQALMDDLKAAYRVRRDPYSIYRVEWENDAAKEIWATFNRKCRFRPDAAYFARSAEMAGRIATILAVGRDIDFPTVSVADIQWGIAVAQCSAERMASEASANVSDTPWGREGASIIAKLRSSPGGRCRQRDIAHALGIPTDAMRKHVEHLHSMELLTLDIVKPVKGGREIVTLVAVHP